MDDKQFIETALRRDRSEVPQGFSYGVIQKILDEKIRRAEVAAKQQSLFVAVAVLLLSAGAIFLLNLAGQGELDWFNNLPFNEIVWLCG